jgi:hypothetical protein
VSALTNSPTTTQRFGAESGCLSGAGELMFLFLALALLRHLLGRFKRAPGTTSDSSGRRLARHDGRGRSPAYPRRSASKPLLPAARQKARRAAVNAAARNPAAVPPVKTRRPVEAWEALRRSCAAMGEAPETDVR